MAEAVLISGSFPPVAEPEPEAAQLASLLDSGSFRRCVGHGGIIGSHAWLELRHECL
jgi:hypothetical protein